MTPAELVDRLLARAATCSRNATAFHQQKLYAEAHVQDAKADAFRLAAEEAKSVSLEEAHHEYMKRHDAETDRMMAKEWGTVRDATTQMRGMR